MPWAISVRGIIITPDAGPTFRQDHPKTSNGFSTVPVPGFVAEVLAAWLALVVGVPDKEQLLFYSRNNAAMQPGNLRQTGRTIRAANEQLGYVVPHKLRKTLATLLADTRDGVCGCVPRSRAWCSNTVQALCAPESAVRAEGATILDTHAPVTQLELTQ